MDSPVTSLTNNGGSALISYRGVTGTYPITLVVTTNEGCSDSITLEVSRTDVIFSQNTFTWIMMNITKLVDSHRRYR